MRSKKWKRFLSGVLTVAMASSMVPSVCYATDVKASEDLSDGVIAEFTFDNDVTGFTSNGFAAKKMGAGLKSATDAAYGHALSIGSSSYLSVADSDGKSPLNGRDEVTINYYSKPSGSGKGWAFFAPRNGEEPKYHKAEHYLGILDKPSSIKVERYLCDNADKRADTNDASGNFSDWKMVTVVVKEDSTSLYVNGDLQNTVASEFLLSDILEDNSTFQIGKANWEGGEYYNGLIDEFTIYDHALTTEEIAEKYEYDKTHAGVISDEEKLAIVENEIAIDTTKKVKGNISLVTDNDYDAVITWKSSNSAVITDEPVVNADYDDIPAGVVTRGKEDVQVTLSAHIELGELTSDKTYTVTVEKQAEEKKLEDYIFVFFPSNSEEQLYLAAGKDPLHFTDLNDGEPILTSKIGDQGVRDPYILRSAEGDHFYMLATDLKVQTTGWGDAQYNGSLQMLVWESDDLVNWSEPRLVDTGLNDLLLSDDDIKSLGCLWAPEAIYDEKTGEYVVYWASMTTDKNGNQYQITYYSKTRDFVHFTDAKTFIDRGNQYHTIDTTIVQGNDGKYYRSTVKSTANGGTEPGITYETSDTILGSWKQLGYMSDLQANMQGYSDFYAKTKISFKAGVVEGPELFKFNDGINFGLYADNYGGVGYVPTSTTDLSDISGASWKVYQPSDYNFGSLKKRHGSILGVTAEEYAAVTAKWGSDPIEKEEEEKQDAVLAYDFEETTADAITDKSGNGNNGTLNGNAKYVTDSETGSKVLSLDGTTGTFAQFPTGFFDGRDTFTVSFDMKADTVDGNFFNLAIGKSNQKYIFLRARDTSTYLAITTASYTSEDGITASTKSIRNKWHNYTCTFTKNSLTLYIDGVEVGKQTTSNCVSDFGKNVIAYLGKSFYSGDLYTKALYDNVKVYNRELSEIEIAANNGVTLENLKGVSSEDVTIITEDLNTENGDVVLYVSKNNTKSNVNMSAVKLDFELLKGAKIVDGLKASYDLTDSFKITTSFNGVEKTYTIKAVMCNNPVLGGQFADPDIDCFNGKYYIYPTTDGFAGWSGYQFHCFSSDDLVNWKDEGVILDLKADKDYEDADGDLVASVPWSDGSAWAPTIEEKNGKYYFYFCGNDVSTNSKAIGVAYADSPTGPFTVAPKPLITYNSSKAAGVTVGQAIDPSAFTDVDGTTYLAYGNGNGVAGLAQLSDDMLSVVNTTSVTGLTEFRESLVINYRNGLYHYTWACDDTGSENYHTNYGVSKQLGGKVTFKYTILSKDADKDMLGTAHHSILNIPGTDEWYIAYHRFLTPLGQVSSGFGYHRETCIDKLTFDEQTGLMNVVTPTLEGITEPVYAYRTLSYSASEGGSIVGEASQKVAIGGKGTQVIAVADEGCKFVGWSDGVESAARTDENITENLVVRAEFVKLVQSDDEDDKDDDDKEEECAHAYKAITVPATTKADGYTAEVCSKCGELKADSKKVITKISSVIASSRVYTGKAVAAKVTVKDSKGNIIDSKYYTVNSYKNNKNVGQASATVTFKDKYEGKVTVKYNINPKGTSLKSFKKGKKGFTVNWKKQSTQVTGYEIQYSIDKKFKKAKTVKVNNSKTTVKKVNKLKAKKTYYVRIRTYKKVGKKTFCSAWSKAKAVKTK